MSKKRAHALPLHCGDWIKGTATMSAAERGYYLDLLIYCWDADAPLPADTRRQMQIARCTNPREWARVWRVLGARWEPVTGGYINARLEKARAKLQVKRTSGQSGARERWQTDSKRDGKDDSKPHGSVFPIPNSPLGKERPEAHTPRARDDVAPVWNPAGRPSRSHTLVTAHPACEPVAAEACQRGICVPAFLIQRQWLPQCDPEQRDKQGAYRQIQDFIRDTIRALPAGPIGDEPLQFWRKSWAARHGSQAPLNPLSETKGAATVRAMQEALHVLDDAEPEAGASHGVDETGAGPADEARSRSVRRLPGRP